MNLQQVMTTMAITALYGLDAVNAAPAPDSAALSACYLAQSDKLPFIGVVSAKSPDGQFFRAKGDATGIPTGDTPYSLASGGKVLTQIAIGQLVDAGLVKLDAPISEYLPNLPIAFATITVDQLIHHRSGIGGHLQFNAKTAEMMTSARSATDLLPLVLAEPLDFSPGTQMKYSNGGYFVLGAIIEAVSHTTYAAYLDAKIFKPLGMARSRTTSDAGTAISMSRMGPPGHPLRASPQPVPGEMLLPGNPAGDSVSTANDLQRLVAALLRGRLLSQETRVSIFGTGDGRWHVGQAGGRPGANTFLSVDPEKGTDLIVLTNYDPPNGDLMGLTLAAVLKGGPCQPRGGGGAAPGHGS